MRAVAASLGLLALCACADPPAIEPIRDPCPASGLAELEPAPVLDLTPEQQAAIDMAVISAVGFDPALAYTRHHDVEVPARTRRLETRVETFRQWCQERAG